MTIKNINLTDEWQDLNKLVGVAVGKPMFIQNESIGMVYLSEGDSPSGYVSMRDSRYPSSVARIPAGSGKIWVKGVKYSPCSISVQELV